MNSAMGCRVECTRVGPQPYAPVNNHEEVFVSMPKWGEHHLFRFVTWAWFCRAYPVFATFYVF